MKAILESLIPTNIQAVHEEDGILSYFGCDHELRAEIYYEEEEIYKAIYYPIEKPKSIVSKEEARVLSNEIISKFKIANLTLESATLEADEYIYHYCIVEPVYKVKIPNSGCIIKLNFSGELTEIALFNNEFTIDYPETTISKEEAYQIICTQDVLQLGISPELDWQYAYTQNYNLYGVNPDGKVRLMEDEPIVKGAEFKPLPDCEPIDDFEAFLKGGRNAQIHYEKFEDENYWSIEFEEDKCIEGDHLTRAHQAVKYIAGEHYSSYYLEHIPGLTILAGDTAVEETYRLYRFVYIHDGISFDFHAITVGMNTRTNQIYSISQRVIPCEKFQELKQPIVTAEEANQIAYSLLDVELTLERDLEQRNRFSFVYMIDYPTSPTKGHLQAVNAFTKELLWVDTGWE